MQKEIGIIAGEVWHYLNERGPVSTLKLKSSLGISNSLLFTAIGWLLREEKIQIQETGNTFIVFLR